MTARNAGTEPGVAELTRPNMTLLGIFGEQFDTAAGPA